jgi:hypothetical protein
VYRRASRRLRTRESASMDARVGAYRLASRASPASEFRFRDRRVAVCPVPPHRTRAWRRDRPAQGHGAGQKPGPPPTPPARSAGPVHQARGGPSCRPPRRGAPPNLRPHRCARSSTSACRPAPRGPARCGPRRSRGRVGPPRRRGVLPVPGPHRLALGVGSGRSGPGPDSRGRRSPLAESQGATRPVVGRDSPGPRPRLAESQRATRGAEPGRDARSGQVKPGQAGRRGAISFAASGP